jgi:peptidoglycan/LPS O-acetylase OafA/YrhL
LSGLVSEVVVLLSFIVVVVNSVVVYSLIKRPLLKLGQTTIKLNEKTTSETRPTTIKLNKKTTSETRPDNNKA